MAQNIFKGLGIALITPFTQDGEVDYKALTRLIDYQIQNGADFLCILATTGETPCLSTDEKHKIKELVIDRVRGRLPILMGCGGNNTRAVARLPLASLMAMMLAQSFAKRTVVSGLRLMPVRPGTL